MSYFNVNAGIMFKWNKIIEKNILAFAFKKKERKKENKQQQQLKKKQLEIQRINLASNIHPTQQNARETCNIILKTNENRTKTNGNIYTYYYWSKNVFRVPFFAYNFW